MLRNQEVARAAVAALALVAACAVAAVAVGAAGFLPRILLAAVAAAAPWIWLTRKRYQAIARLSQSIDAVLHGDRSIDLASMSEGELAILESELGKMVMRLNLTADELEREKQTLANGLADISHQIKTPLTSLSITTELVRKALDARGDCADEVERLHRIERLQAHVEDLVSTLLRLARLDAGALALAHEQVDVSDMARDAARPLAIAFDLADVALELDIEDGCSFTGDRAWTAEALGNILKNCLEHTPRGGRVTVAAHEDALACRIRMEDTGPGIAEEDLPHVFERFYRGASDRTGASAVNPTGVGIGLSLAQGLIDAQDGTICASNARDEAGRVTGARFDIAFFKAIV